VTVFRLNWLGFSNSTDETKKQQTLSCHTQKALTHRVEENLILDVQKGDKSVRLSALTLAHGTTMSQLANSYGILFEEPHDRWHSQTIFLILDAR
jgi:hypothetical protein